MYFIASPVVRGDAWNQGGRPDVSETVEFERLYDEHASSLIGQVALVTGDVGAAQDAVQEAWVKAWLRWDKVSAYDNPAAWVRRVAMNTAVSRWRRTRRLVLKASVGSDGVRPSIESHDDSTDRLVDLQRAIATLPPISRRIVVLYYLVGLSVDEVAEEVGVPAGTVKSRLSRSRDRLATRLEHDEETHHV
jgi:RNA polymerase sigma-70 factor (ECF subfamily)